LVNNYTTLPLGSALAQSIGNLLEVLVATALLRRWCLDALQNVTKHAGCDARATVTLCQEPRALRFEVIDAGGGFDVAGAARGSGLANMRDRVEAVGGSLKVISMSGAGTTVRGQVPIGRGP
jgi:signal transduction histidine kinase